MERLQKVLAQAGVASRRKSETLIVEGKVKVNGVVVTELRNKSFEFRSGGSRRHQLVKRTMSIIFYINRDRSFRLSMMKKAGRRYSICFLW